MPHVAWKVKFRSRSFEWATWRPPLLTISSTSKHVLLRWFLLLTLSSGGCWLSFPPFSGWSLLVISNSLLTRLYQKLLWRITTDHAITSLNNNCLCPIIIISHYHCGLNSCIMSVSIWFSVLWFIMCNIFVKSIKSLGSLSTCVHVMYINVIYSLVIAT